ncbi:E3 ubiquitin-protein ligase Siah1-like [Coccinella septempunctata]|uniref:E3 ubiquitin-protein ligase Siah1-like n=1 Tax=Coccinella septempunctata TaxID=41139 RepID=UPI001D08027C|nr:E3 ubiquitin-protein ligase Siah1-like [Coccinella septempunctata]
MKPEHIAMNEYVKDLLTCPRCHIIITPPYQQCKMGHLRCSSAECETSDSETVCYCGETFLMFKISSLEKIYDALVFTCKFSQNGCIEVSLKAKDLKKHEEGCKFSPKNNPEMGKISTK